MKMNKIGKIVKYNLEKNLRNSWFIGLNAILLVVAIVALNFTTVKTILENKHIISTDKEFNIEILDNTNIFYNELQKNLEEMDNVILSKIDSVSYDENMPKDRIIIEVKKSNENIIDVKAISKDGIDKKYYTPIEKSLETTKEKLISERYDITSAQIEKIKGPVDVERIMVGVDNSNSDVKQIAQTIVSYITLLILMLILSKIAGDISQEKITKSIEYVLTSISAKDYLIAKVISINLTMIIQVVFTFVYFIIASSINSILNMTFGNVMLNVPEGGFSLASIGSLIDSTMILYILVVFLFLIITVSNR